MCKNTLISLLVIRTFNFKRVVEFYKYLGLDFVEEKHGEGPVHYVCLQEGIVIEIYPGEEHAIPQWNQAGAVMFGFSICNIDIVLQGIEERGGRLVTQPAISERGVRALIEDPDGRRIELIEQLKP